MWLKRLVVGMTLCGLSASAAVTVKDVVCQQRYPWNGLVDIDYTVEVDDAAADVWVYPMGQNRDAATTMPLRSLTGAGATNAVKAGRHRMTWNAAADYPGFSAEAFSVKMTALTGAAPYLVIDLSGGTNATTYGVTHLTHVPEGGWSDLYKTTNLVLRLIPPGTFRMGSPSDELGRESGEGLHTVTLTKPFYIGVFEVTECQYGLVMGSANGSTIPAHYLSYNDIRGTVNGAGWPTHNQVDADTFMGRLRAKANVLADLPTEAQWEYACRAGTSTALNNGKNLTSVGGRCANLDEVAWYHPRTDGNFTMVGSFAPNAWGVYDMHGNVTEWCLDGIDRLIDLGDETDPKGAGGEYRILRGGGCFSNGRSGDSPNCRSAWRAYGTPSARNGNTFYGSGGFRLVILPAVD